MGKRLRFSIITAFHCWNDYREKAIQRAIKSIEKQTFRDFEYIIVNDGSTREFKVPKWVKVVNKVHEERVAAYNEGFKHAKGEIFCQLDSDDEYEPNYLERVDSFFRQYPAYKLFNFGCTFIHSDGGTALRGAFKPKKKRVGHESFGGGNIVNGTFVWHRSVYDDLGAFPPTHMRIDCSPINYNPRDKNGEQIPGERDLYAWTPYDVSAWFQMEYPEQRKFFMVDHVNEPSKIIKEIGNPWGNDHILFYKYTRKYHSKPIDEYLYVVHLKKGVE